MLWYDNDCWVTDFPQNAMKKFSPIFLISLFLFLTGCAKSGPAGLDLTQTFESAVGTAIVETIEASLQQNVDSPEPSFPASETPTSVIQPTATPELVPTNSPVPIQPTPTTVPTPCYRAELVEETVPDGTKFSPGKAFAKTWIIRNTGVCEWTEEFRWVLVDGEDFSGVTDVPLNQDIQPGEDLQVLLELKAPLFAGTYKGTYQIFTDEGASVTPLGFWLTIVVE